MIAIYTMAQTGMQTGQHTTSSSCYQSSESAEVWYIKVCRDISLQARNLSWQWELVRPNFLRFRSKEQMVVAIISDDSRCDYTKDLRRDRVLGRR